MNETLYRKGVVALIRNPDGLYLMGHIRSLDRAGWQFPQGGIEAGETPEDAVHREIFEETGLAGLTVVQSATEWIRYDWPEALRRAGDPRVGQMHQYMVLEAKPERHLSPTPTDDFDRYEWMSPTQIMTRCLEFKRAAYHHAFQLLGISAGGTS
ncbi:MAG: NUDIX domain-containing protein [Proteobacteria bacterium]|nr:MAG: NUDIX domain-containing protein [Pseudomonadota bacterium]